MDPLRSLLERLSWMAPPLALVVALALVIAALYTALAARPLWALPLSGLVSVAGLVTGQVVATVGPRWLPIGDFALGTGLAVCAGLFAAVHVLTLWYTRDRRALRRGRLEPVRRERLHR